jgi:CubicO group peptidase (beta-lactamase class C family)
MRSMTRLVILLALLVAIMSLPSLMAQASRPAADTRLDSVAKVVDAKMKELGVPGVVVGILENGTTTTRVFGVTNVDHPLPVTDSTLFQIGSISKTFTGTLMMRLAEQGKVDLGSPVRTYLPAFKVKDANASARAVVRDTLTHMGGWEGDFFIDEGLGDDALARGVARMADLEQTAPVGKVWGYNNSGFYAAGRIIELVTGKTYEQALTEMVVQPLGLKNTFIMPTDALTRRYAVGHGGPASAQRVIGPWHIGRVAHAAGGVFTDIRDLLAYARFHLGDGSAVDGTRLLTQSSLTRMHAPVHPKLGTQAEMAITWHLTKESGVAVHAHGGGTNGQLTYLALVPAKRLAIAILTNSGSGSRLHREVLRAALREYAGAALNEPVATTGTESELQRFVGRWSRQYQDAVITLKDGKLSLQVVPKMTGLDGKVSPPSLQHPVSLAQGGGLVITDGPLKNSPIDAIAGDAGSVEWLRIGGRIHRRAAASSTSARD